MCITVPRADRLSMRSAAVMFVWRGLAWPSWWFGHGWSFPVYSLFFSSLMVSAWDFGVWLQCIDCPPVTVVGICIVSLWRTRASYFKSIFTNFSASGVGLFFEPTLQIYGNLEEKYKKLWQVCPEVPGLWWGRVRSWRGRKRSRENGVPAGDGWGVRLGSPTQPAPSSSAPGLPCTLLFSQGQVQKSVKQPLPTIYPVRPGNTTRVNMETGLQVTTCDVPICQRRACVMTAGLWSGRFMLSVC